MALKDVKLSAFKTLIPKTQADWLHVSICLNIFLIVWHGLEWIDPSINGIWFVLLAAALAGLALTE
ncbi:hypothetical protein Peternella1_55 [Winogradskyella phage Peternella_1]|uniref:Uncharacterized protein n=1 Tax=Winogradskyella phage Peternella_1 TaxID=2745699 RepID=A0A8E4ZL84_9CAUD|nr:hypothetical protein M1M32_gp55 [Winogradskyella phage Peternella_1]QQV91591.1 hypothetical protein Peternella1_55 [Winogradskyella phage Peternella_1]